MIPRPDIECQTDCNNPEIYELGRHEYWGGNTTIFICKNCTTPFKFYEILEIHVIYENENPTEYNKLTKIFTNQLIKKIIKKGHIK